MVQAALVPCCLQVKHQLWPLEKKLRVITTAKEFVKRQEEEMEVLQLQLHLNLHLHLHLYLHTTTYTYTYT